MICKRILISVLFIMSSFVLITTGGCTDSWNTVPAKDQRTARIKPKPDLHPPKYKAGARAGIGGLITRSFELVEREVTPEWRDVRLGLRGGAGPR
jgi:hypothetical protein